MNRSAVHVVHADERPAPPRRAGRTPLVAVSPAMQATLARARRAAEAEVTVLLLGETGTGKSQLAEEIHWESARRGGPFVVVDCGAIPANLVESELFGHERGAFTGADARRTGAFEEAEGGTLFLDEVAELPLELQSKLLRALDTREIRRVGQNRYTPVDVRVVAATNRCLAEEVALGRFRADLYYRLAVVTIVVPPLRERREDIPALVKSFLEQARAQPAQAARVLRPEHLAELAGRVWAGNVRELRNVVEQCLVLGEANDVPASGREVLSYREAKRRAHDAFERAYLADLLGRFHGCVTAAAKAADVDRVYVHRLLRRHGIRASR